MPGPVLMIFPAVMVGASLRLFFGKNSGNGIRCALIELVPCAGDDVQLCLRQKFFKLPGDLQIGMVLFAAQKRYRAFDFMQSAAEIKGAHGAGQADNVLLCHTHIRERLLRHTAEQEVLEINKKRGNLILYAD